MTREFEEIERKWADAWAREGAHEPDASPGTPKFFATYPYSYMNAFPHVGHAYTMSRVDFFTRYQRMLGKRVLFPMGFHVTGTPIVAAANRVREGEENQIRILEQQGIPAEEIPKFADPEHWVRFFPKEWRKDLERLGLGVDWRREFHTTSLNPHYDAFIQWQFRRLHEGGYVGKGRHPIIWCPKDQAPVADHDRYEGEGETPQEWTLYLMRVQEPADLGLDAEGAGGDVFVVTATLRPDTVFGQTNVWADPAHAYRVVRVGDDRWIVNQDAADVIHYQYPDAVVEDATVPGERLLGLKVRAPGVDRWVPVLPAAFIRHDKGTGLVTSVPSDSPQDLLSLRAVTEGAIDAPERAREAAQAIEIIPVIRTEKYGTESAAKAVEETGARDHLDAANIAKATEKAYQAGFYEGVMLENARQFAGKPVADAKDPIREWLVEQGEAVPFYWPSGKVVCRCLTPSVVKIVTDQWFVKYGDRDWKERAQECLDGMRLYPESARKQFNYVIGWLKDWACVREAGLGTRLPWDERWLIESLSDSTIYMAYYTFAHLVERGAVTGGGSTGAREGVDPADLTDAFFDYVLLGQGSPDKAANGSVTAELAEACRREFAYWYPLDFRNSGKDLVQNHLSFMVFNHVAVWPDTPGVWPKAIGVNGWVNVDGEKMSKSRGNFIMLRQALDEFGVTATRLALVNAGEGVDDANFDREFAATITRRIHQWFEHALAAAKGDAETRTERLPVDDWFTSVLQRHVGVAREQMEETMFRSAFKTAFYDLGREWQWYVKRAGVPHVDVLREYVDVTTRMLTPFVPHLAEEVHHAAGKDGLAIDAPYPEPREDAIDAAAEEAEKFVRATLDDAREILKVTGIDAKAVTFYTAPAWKRGVLDTAITLALEGDGKVNQGQLMKTVMQDPEARKHGKEAPKVAADAVKRVTTQSREELALARAAAFDEPATLEAAASFLSRELGGADVRVQAADAADLEDPAGKARHAMPGRPAIYIV